MEILNHQLTQYLNPLKTKTQGVIELTEDLLNGLYSVYPFNRFEYVIAHLLAHSVITLNDYQEIRNDYLERNHYLYLFEINAPRKFGETWVQNHLSEFVPELCRPSKNYDNEYKGEYDFWLEGQIRIEVKASRAVDAQSDESLVIKALASTSQKAFNMNFQQIKPDCCDVFVWIAVWRDTIKYWVLSSNEVSNNKYFSKGQHRGNNGEGQLWLTEKNISEFDQFLVQPRNLLTKIKEKANQ